MATYLGVTSAVFFIWVMTFLAQNYFVTGSIHSACRIMGIGIYLDQKVNFSGASDVCNQFNLQLARKDQVEEALKRGFETCNFGWVKDGFVVIPRITSNQRCGQGKTGLVRWNAEKHRTFHVYCFNSSGISYPKYLSEAHSVNFLVPKKLPKALEHQSGKSVKPLPFGFFFCKRDCVIRLPMGIQLENNVQINSCEPDPTTTTFLSSSASTDLTAYSASDLTENITAVPTVTVTESEKFLKNRFRIICVTETILPTEGPTTQMPEEHSPTDSPKHTPHLAFKNDAVVFGGIPTALLVLAIIFFIISVVLAVCYIKRYKKTLPFFNKNQQKETVVTTALKETKSNDQTPEKETQNNGNKVEECKTKPEATVKCLEAEV